MRRQGHAAAVAADAAAHAAGACAVCGQVPETTKVREGPRLSLQGLLRLLAPPRRAGAQVQQRAGPGGGVRAAADARDDEYCAFTRRTLADLGPDTSPPLLAAEARRGARARERSVDAQPVPPADHVELDPGSAAAGPTRPEQQLATATGASVPADAAATPTPPARLASIAAADAAAPGPSAPTTSSSATATTSPPAPDPPSPPSRAPPANAADARRAEEAARKAEMKRISALRDAGVFGYVLFYDGCGHVARSVYDADRGSQSSRAAQHLLDSTRADSTHAGSASSPADTSSSPSFDAWSRPARAQRGGAARLMVSGVLTDKDAVESLIGAGHVTAGAPAGLREHGTRAQLEALPRVEAEVLDIVYDGGYAYEAVHDGGNGYDTPEKAGFLSVRVKGTFAGPNGETDLILFGPPAGEFEGQARELIHVTALFEGVRAFIERAAAVEGTGVQRAVADASAVALLRSVHYAVRSVMTRDRLVGRERWRQDRAREREPLPSDEVLALARSELSAHAAHLLGRLRLYTSTAAEPRIQSALAQCRALEVVTRPQSAAEVTPLVARFAASLFDVTAVGVPHVAQPVRHSHEAPRASAKRQRLRLQAATGPEQVVVDGTAERAFVYYSSSEGEQSVAEYVPRGASRADRALQRDALKWDTPGSGADGAGRETPGSGADGADADRDEDSVGAGRETEPPASEAPTFPQDGTSVAAASIAAPRPVRQPRRPIPSIGEAVAQLHRPPTTSEGGARIRDWIWRDEGGAAGSTEPHNTSSRQGPQQPTADTGPQLPAAFTGLHHPTPVASFPATCSVSARVYHRGAATPRGTYSVGDFVRLPLTVAEAALQQDVVSHAHLPRGLVSSPEGGVPDALQCFTASHAQCFTASHAQCVAASHAQCFTTTPALGLGARDGVIEPLQDPRRLRRAFSGLDQRSDSEADSYEVVRIVAMFVCEDGVAYAHVQRYARTRDSIMGEWGDPHELLRVDECATLPLMSIVEGKHVGVLDSSVGSADWVKTALPAMEGSALDHDERLRLLPRNTWDAVLLPRERAAGTDGERAQVVSNSEATHEREAPHERSAGTSATASLDSSTSASSASPAASSARIRAVASWRKTGGRTSVGVSAILPPLKPVPQHAYASAPQKRKTPGAPGVPMTRARPPLRYFDTEQGYDPETFYVQQHYDLAGRFTDAGELSTPLMLAETIYIPHRSDSTDTMPAMAETATLPTTALRVCCSSCDAQRRKAAAQTPREIPYATAAAAPAGTCGPDSAASTSSLADPHHLDATTAAISVAELRHRDIAAANNPPASHSPITAFVFDGKLVTVGMGVCVLARRREITTSSPAKPTRQAFGPVDESKIETATPSPAKPTQQPEDLHHYSGSSAISKDEDEICTAREREEHLVATQGRNYPELHARGTWRRPQGASTGQQPHVVIIVTGIERIDCELFVTGVPSYRPAETSLSVDEATSCSYLELVIARSCEAVRVRADAVVDVVRVYNADGSSEAQRNELLIQPGFAGAMFARGFFDHVAAEGNAAAAAAEEIAASADAMEITIGTGQRLPQRSKLAEPVAAAQLHPCLAAPASTSSSSSQPVAAAQPSSSSSQPVAAAQLRPCRAAPAPTSSSSSQTRTSTRQPVFVGIRGAASLAAFAGAAIHAASLLPILPTTARGIAEAGRLQLIKRRENDHSSTQGDSSCSSSLPCSSSSSCSASASCSASSSCSASASCPATTHRPTSSSCSATPRTINPRDIFEVILPSTLNPPLRVLDAFAGGGGFSTGASSVDGVTPALAIEYDSAVAEIYKLNHPDTEVITNSIDSVLRAMQGDTQAPTVVTSGSRSRQRTTTTAAKGRGASNSSAANPSSSSSFSPFSTTSPASTSTSHSHSKSTSALATLNRDPHNLDIDLVAGGPPCQGFSGANRLEQDSETRANKNCMAATYLSLVDRLRPPFMILENVPTLSRSAGSKRGEEHDMLRMLLGGLREMQYQVAVAVVDAGQGIAQSRTRLIILAAAPGQVLPSHPPQDFVSESGNTRLSLSTGMRGRERAVEIHSSRLGSAAILRAPVVRDAIGDLAVPVDSGRDEPLLPARSPFQVTAREDARRLLDGGGCYRPTGTIRGSVGCSMSPDTASPTILRSSPRGLARDHVTRPVGEVDAARIRAVPKDHPGADWRLMRNQAVTLPSGAVIPRAFFFGRDMSALPNRAAAQPASNRAAAQPASSSAATQPASSRTTAQPASSHDAAQPASSRAAAQPGSSRTAAQPASSHITAAQPATSNRGAAQPASSHRAAAQPASTRHTAAQPPLSQRAAHPLLDPRAEPHPFPIAPSMPVAIQPAHQHAQIARAICACQLDESADRRRRLHKAGKLCRHFGERTLIPFFAAHRAAMNNGFVGVYGRLSDLCQANTLTTIPALNGKGGRLIHPHEDRVITVREAARLQGFPDAYRFSAAPAQNSLLPTGSTAASRSSQPTTSSTRSTAASSSSRPLTDATMTSSHRLPTSAAASSSSRPPTSAAASSSSRAAHHAAASSDPHSAQRSADSDDDVTEESASVDEAGRARSRIVATSFRVIGNAIPPTLGRALALQVMKASRQGRERDMNI